MSEDSSSENETPEDIQEGADAPDDAPVEEGGQDSEAAPSAEGKPKEAEPEAPASTDVISFQKKVDIHCGVPLPSYNNGPNKAYKAVAKDKAGTGLFAIVCERNLVPRLKAAKTYGKIINPNMGTLVLHGAVFWPPAKEERYVFIYLDNLGKPILTHDKPQFLGWKQESVMDIIVKPMVNVLQDFQDKDFVHGGIRPSNFFDAQATGQPKRIMLGDCLSGPCSYMQPVLYETVERSMADPIARGVGTLADDLYALGVSLAVCLRGNDPLKDLSSEEIIRQKLQLGSYAAVTGKDRFKGDILELLRGLLHDDPAQRWKVDEVLIWMDGTRLSPRQALARKKAARSIAFSNEKYIFAERLAMDIGTNPTELKRIVEDDSLNQWIKRSLEDDEVLASVEKAVQNSKQGGTGSGFEERLVSNISAALDPIAPLRFKGLKINGDGMGPALAEVMVLEQDPKVYAEMLASGLVLDWIATQSNPNLDINALFHKFEQCRRIVKNNKLGEGLERCLYILSPEAPCYSPVLKGYYVTSPGQMLVAFEKMCQKKNAPGMFLDRHSVAYLMQRESRVIESFIFELNQPEQHKVILGNLKCLAAIQKGYEIEKLPGLSAFFANKLAAVYEEYHDRKVRDKIKKAIDEISEGGDLVKMVAVLDNVDLMNKDAKAYRKALEEFAGLQKEKEELEKKLENQETFGVETGQEIAAVVAAGLAAIVIVGSALMFFSGSSIF